MTATQLQVWKDWRQQGRPSYPSKEQEPVIHRLLGAYWQWAPNYHDPYVQFHDRKGFINELWDWMRDGAPMSKDRIRVLLTHPDREVRQWGLRISGAAAQ